ncbi:hypothetical protein F5Y03DRAFT_399374 [Xylaria venustula]|nr:hypothetical protein F5Y03DRAFT_399374 [Xylaria venustula]
MDTRLLKLKISSDDPPDGCPRELPKRCPQYRTTQDLIDYAFRLLRRDCMRSCLVETTLHFISGLKGKNSLWRQPNRREIERPVIVELVDEFLSKLYEEFPEVLLTQNVEGEASVQPNDWATEQESPTVRSWSGRNLGEMKISRDIIDCIVSSKSVNAAYRSFKFQMIVAVVHEIAHLLRITLAGGRFPETPAKPRDRGKGKGEAGFLLELKAFGGIAEFYAPIHQPHDTDQPGIPYMFNGTKDEDQGVVLDEETIRSFVEDTTYRSP